MREAKENWVTARRAILRKPIDRIGYGGYLKLACAFPEFIDYVESVCNEFRELYDNIKGTTPYCVKTVAVLNCWGKMRAWGCHMVHHALYQKQNYSYAGVIEALSGAPFDVRFISFVQRRRLDRCGRARGPSVRGALSAAGWRAGRGEGDGLHTGIRQIQLGRAPGPLHSAGLHEAGGFWRGQEEHLRAPGYRDLGAA